jgi:small-conductance mechanosensitive channel
LEFVQNLLQSQDSDGFLLYWAKEILGALLILALFWALSRLFVKILNKFGTRITAFTSTDLDDRLLQRLIPYVSRLFLVLGVYLAVRSLPLNEKLILIVSGIIYIILVVIVCNLIYHSVDEFLKWYAAGQEATSAAVLSRQLVPIAEKIISLFLLGTALIIVLKHFNVDIFSLVTALGIGSLAIGMAAKDTLAHMISGFTLMLDRPFQIGDRIKLVGGQIGDVVDIGLRTTKIQALDTTVMIIPNSDLCNSTVINLVRPTSVIQCSITVGVGYNSDIDRVKELLLEIAGDNPQVLNEPSPQVFFISFGDSALNMLFHFWIDNPVYIKLVTDQLNCSILKRFREQNIEIPFPVRTVIMEKGHE